METEIHQASESGYDESISVEFSSNAGSEPDYFSGRDFGDEDAHDLFEI